MMHNNRNLLPRSTLIAWIRSLLPDLSPSIQIQELAKGVIYCRIINQFFPGSIFLNRIIWVPKSQYECLLNLKILQNALMQLKVNIPFEPSKVVKEKSQQNIALASAIYRHFNHEEISFQEKAVYGVGVKRPMEAAGIEHFYYQRPSYMGQARLHQNKYSCGRLIHQSSSQNPPSPTKGKWSVNSHVFQNNLIPVIDRVKEILLKSSHDTQKIRLVKMLLNIPLNEEIVKVEEDEIDTQIIQVNLNQTIQLDSGKVNDKM